MTERMHEVKHHIEQLIEIDARNQSYKFSFLLKRGNTCTFVVQKTNVMTRIYNTSFGTTSCQNRKFVFDENIIISESGLS